MQTSTDVVLALSTTADESSARTLALRALESGLVACVNLVPGVTSLYRWQGRIEESREWLMVIKTSRARWPALRQAWSDWHPYDVPELIALDISDGLEPYLRWVISEVGAPLHQATPPAATPP